MLDRLLCELSDLLINVALYLDPFDTRQLAAASKPYCLALASDFLWLRYLQKRIPGFIRLSSNELCTLQNLLCIRNKYEMYFRFRRMTFPLLGYYACQNDLGSLFCIKVSDGAITCKPISTSDEEIDDYPGFEYTYNNKEMTHLSMCQETATIDENSLQFTFESKRTLTLCPIPPLCDKYPLARNHYELARHLQSEPDLHFTPQLSALAGLAVGEYGPHGAEILHLSIQAPCSEAHTEFSESAGMLSCWRLRGLKVTGDRNVPNGKVSFCIDLRSSIDVADVLQQDTRPFIVQQAGGAYQQVFLHSVARRVAGWYRGKGQINALQDRWQPEWVDCMFLLYSQPCDSSGAMGVLLWHRYRHGQEIYSMKRSNAEISKGFSYS